MAGTQLRIDGLDELRKALLALPHELVRDAGEIVQAQANEAARQIAAGYPVVTGNLRDHLRIEIRSQSTGSASVSVRNTAKHAWLYEHGSRPRRHANGASTGSMPARPLFIPIAIRRRQVMVAALVDLVERAGLHVTGTSA